MTPIAGDVHRKSCSYEGVDGYAKGCDGQCKLETNEFIPFVVKLDVDIVFCVNNVPPDLLFCQRRILCTISVIYE